MNRIKMFYTIFVIISLAAFEHMVIGLFPPLFSDIANDIHVPVASMGIISATNILVTALASIYWGYLAGKFNRKKLIIIGTSFWVVSIFLTSTSSNFIQLLLYQILTGIGLGSMAAVGFSVLTDYVSFKRRGMVLSLWGMAQGFGGIAGSLLASVIASAYNWRVPFELLSYIGLVLIVLYYFIEDPPIGNSEPELQSLIQNGDGYHHTISLRELAPIFFKKSNIFLFSQGFFMNIATGSLIWLPTLYIVKIQQQGIPEKIAIIVAAILYGLFQLGGLTSSLFGYWGDKIQQKTYKGRARLTATFVFLTFPFYVLMFFIPLHHFQIPDTTNTFLLVLGIGKEVLTNPWIFLLFIIAFIASAAQSANTPNWLALITDVNLPEHRGMIFSIGNLINSLGRTLGNVGITFILSYMLSIANEVNSYIWTLALLQLPLIPSAICYVIMANSNDRDIRNVKLLLKKRGNTNNF